MFRSRLATFLLNVRLLLLLLLVRASSIHDLHGDMWLIIELSNSAHRHLLAVLKLRELLDHTIQPCILSLRLLDLYVFHLNGLVGSSKHLLQLHVLSCGLHELALVLVTRGSYCL